MTVRELAQVLAAASRAGYGDQDVVFIQNAQFQDIASAQLLKEPTSATRWCWSGPVLLLTLGEG